MNKEIKINPDNPHRENWFTTDIAFEAIIRSSRNFNPREDMIPFNRITEIITENGSLSQRKVKSGTQSIDIFFKGSR
jgi:methylthioribose-1-phosphate isomerase